MKFRLDIARAIHGAAAVCIAVAWLMPNHYPPWSSYYNELAMAVGLTLAAGAVLYGQSTAKPQLPLTAFAVLVLSAVPWFQWVAGVVPYTGDAWVVTLYLCGLASAVFVGSAAFDPTSRNPALSTTLAWATVAGASVSAILGILQSLEVSGLGIWMSESGYGSRASGNLAQPNNLGTLLTWGLLSVLILREKGSIGRLGSLGLTALMLIALAFTQSRTALVQGPIVLAGLAWARTRGVRLQTSLWTIAAVTVALWLMAWLTPATLDALLLAKPETLAQRGAASARFAMWPTLIDAVSMRPWHGYGWLQVGAAQFAAADHHPGTGEMWLQAHDFFLELVLWMGYPIGLAVGALVIYWFASRWSRVRTLEATIGLLVMSVCAAHGLLEFPYQYAYFLIPMGLWAGIVDRQSGGKLLPPTHATLVLPAATLALLFALTWNYGEVEDDYRLVRFEFLKIGTLKAAQPAPDAPFLSSLTHFLSFSRTTPASRMSRHDLDEMRVQATRYPYAVSLDRYALALALNGRVDEAVVVFEKMRHMHGDATYKRMLRDLQERIGNVSPEQIQLLELEARLTRAAPAQ